MARPIEWTEQKKKDAIAVILERIENGESVRSVLSKLRDKDLLPSRKLFNEWLRDLSGLSDQYVRACVDRADSIFEEIIDIADDSSQDVIHTEKGEVLNSEFVQRSKLRVDARKWAVSKMNPKKYGDKQVNENLNTNINVEVSKEEAKAISQAIKNDI